MSGRSATTDASIKNFKSSQNLDIQVRGGSRLTGDIEAGDVFIQVKEAGNIQLKGAGRYATIKGWGAQPIRLQQFTVETADVQLNGSISIWVNAKRKLDYSLKESCTLFSRPARITA